MKRTFFDVHLHVFNVTHIPMMTILKRYGLPLQIGILDWKFLKVDERTRSFIRMSEHPVLDILSGIEKEIDEAFQKSGGFDMPDEIILTPLMINFEYEDKLKKAEIQINDTIQAIKAFLKKPHKIPVKVYPFLGIEPSKKEAIPLMKKYIKRKKGVSGIKNGEFIGVKIYPPMGLDLDLKACPQLHKFFKYCQDHDIPITTHCATGGFVSKKVGVHTANSYCHPKKWEKILERYPKLRVNFGHFGALKFSWKRKIIKYMKQYDHIYSDVSSMLNFRFLWFNHFGTLKKLVKHSLIGGRVLYGTDYYIVKPFMRNYGRYGDYLLPAAGSLKKDFYKIASDNPKKFLRLKD